MRIRINEKLSEGYLLILYNSQVILLMEFLKYLESPLKAISMVHVLHFNLDSNSNFDFLKGISNR